MPPVRELQTRDTRSCPRGRSIGRRPDICRRNRGVNLTIPGVTVVVIRPIELLPALVNHSAPSGPAAIPSG
jgi:hypothetical protein